MTRKQALSGAIQMLSSDEKNRDICRALEEMRQELPMAHWTQASILDAVQDYIREHGCLPKPGEMNNSMGMPSHMTIRKLFHMTILEFETAYFPEYLHRCESRVYHRRDRQYWLEDFKRQYEKLGYPAAKTYQRKRDKGTPGVTHIKKLAGAGSWDELIAMCHFEEIERAGHEAYRRMARHPKLEAAVFYNEALSPDEQKSRVDDLEKTVRDVQGDIPNTAGRIDRK